MAPIVWEVLITCEHAGNRIPGWLRKDFQGHENLIQSHCGYDIGALSIAKTFARRLSSPLFFTLTSRLVCDLNRSLGNKTLFSIVTRPLPQSVKNRILTLHYFPHRRKVESHIHSRISRNISILHLAVHTFTPILAGKVRKTDVGLLYDPGRKYESIFCHAWRAELQGLRHDLKIHLNSPYKGTSDGFPTYLRSYFRPGKYIGIELEVNNKLLNPPPHRTPLITSFLLETFLKTFREAL